MIRSTTLSALALAVLVSATAAQNPPAPPKPAPKSTTSAMSAPKPHKVHEATPGLLKQAKVPAATAEQTALASVPGGNVTSRSIEKRKGVLVYAFNIKADGKDGHEAVTVDATTGAVASSMHVAPKPKKKPATK